MRPRDARMWPPGLGPIRRCCRRHFEPNKRPPTWRPSIQSLSAKLFSGAGQEAFALHLLALQLAGAADGLRLLAGAALGRLFVVVAQFHLAEETLALHLLLERLQGLVDIVVTHDNLQANLQNGIRYGPAQGRSFKGAGDTRWPCDCPPLPGLRPNCIS